MFLHQIKYEWLQLTRDRWVTTLLVIFIGLCLFAASNGTKKTESRKAEIEATLAVMTKSDIEHKANIDSVERGLKTVEPWLNPRRLNFIGNRAPRVAAMEPATLAFLSTGQSDLFTHTSKPTLFGESYVLSFTELSNPVQLMFGSFDLAFVLIYLLPLLVLAFSYNLLSSEREQGSLRLTLSQPVSLYSWLLNKMLLRFSIMVGIVTCSLVLAFLFADIPISQLFSSLLTIVPLVLFYILFWFAVALVVNAFGKSSGTNAVTIISIWVILVLLVPATISQLASSLFPVPSRINMIHEMRIAKSEAEKEASKILSSYYRDHPELAQRDTTTKNQYEFYLGYFASQDVVKKSVTPVLEDYQTKLDAQQAFVESFRFISPSLLIQDALNDVAGTSPRHYEAYRNQVVTFAEDWRSFFLPRMFKNEWMKQENFEKLPTFTFSYAKVKSTTVNDFAGLLLFALVTLGTSSVVYLKFSKRVLVAS
jgi:ABC-2 type transport system permease protein